MEFWVVLGLEPTRDMAAITKAYHSKLVQTNPEDKPEEFKALRAAYEQARAWAARPEQDKSTPAEQATPQTPQQRWMQQVRAVYGSMDKRCDPQCWQSLLQDPFCLSLTGRTQARDVLLAFLLHNSLLPQAVWQTLEEAFDFAENRAELCEKFPADFIDNVVINGAQYPEFLDFTRFIGNDGAACDAYISAANAARYALREDDAEKTGQALQKMQAAQVQHPYTLYVKASLLRLQGSNEEAMQAIDEYLQQRQDVQGLILRASLYRKKQELEAAKADLQAALELVPDYGQAHYDLACVLEEMKDYGAAKEQLYILNRSQPRNQALIRQIDAVNEKYLPVLLQKHTEDPVDTETILELAWCYLQQGKMDLSRQTAEELPAEMTGGYEYENLWGKLLLNNGETKQALPHVQAWVHCLENLDPADPKTPDRKGRLPEAYRLLAWTLAACGEKQKACELLEETEQRFPQEGETWLTHAELLLQEKNDPAAKDKAEQCLNTAIEKNDNDGYAYFLRAGIQYDRGRDSAAFADYDKSERFYGRNLNSMAMKIRIWLDNDHEQDARKALEEVKDFPDKLDLSLAFSRARVLALDGKKQEAEDALRRVLQAVQKDEEPFLRPGDVYFQLALLVQERKDDAEVLNILQQGTKAAPKDGRLWDFLSFEQRKQADYDAAEATLRHMIETWPRDPRPLDRLADIYREDRKNYPEAAKLYRQELALRDLPVTHADLAKCLQECEQYAEAETEFLQAIRQDPGQPAYLADLGGLYMAQDRRDEAVQRLQTALDIPGADTWFYNSVRRQLARLYTRIGNYAAAEKLWRENLATGQLQALVDLADLYAHQKNPHKAMELLDEWYARSEKPDRDWYVAKRAYYYMHQAGLNRDAEKLLQGSADNVKCLSYLAYLAFDAGHFRKALALQKRCAEAAPEDTTQLERLALYYWFCKQKDKAAQTARKALKLWDARRGENQRALHHAKRAGLLALCGETEQALQEMQTARKAPLCGFCIYGACKDADIFEEWIWEILGDYQKAAECVRHGQKTAPEETDFRAAAKRLRKKGVNI